MLTVTAVGGFGGKKPEVPYPSVTNELHRFRADLGVTKDGSNYVSQWDDQTGDRDVSEGTNKPLWVAGAVNGKPAIRFDGVNDTMESSGADIGDPLGFFVVVNPVTNANGDKVFGGLSNSSPYSVALELDGSGGIILVAGYGTTAVTCTAGTFFLIHGVVNGSNTTLFSNDGSDGGGSNPVAGRVFNDGFQFADFNNAGPTGNIELAEVIFFSEEKVTTELANLKEYFNSRYNLF